MTRIFITGDCHASYTKLGFKRFPEGRDLSKDDYVIICGDFGYWHDTPEEAYWMDWLENRPFTTLWVDGNHENYDRLGKLPVERWMGGKIQRIRSSVLHLMRGQVYTIDGKSFFTFGGASSHDIRDGILEMDDPDLRIKMKELDARGALYRIDHLSWWKEELPSKEEMEEGIENLNKISWKVDYILTHCSPSSLARKRDPHLYGPDALTDYLDQIKDGCAYRHWFFGHYHENEDWGEKETCLYEDIVELTEEGYRRSGLISRYSVGDVVLFSTCGKKGTETYQGRIVHVDETGGGLYFGEEPTADIWTDKGFYHKHIPFEKILKKAYSTDGRVTGTTGDDSVKQDREE